MKETLEKCIVLDPERKKKYQEQGWISKKQLTEKDIHTISQILTLESLGFAYSEIGKMLPMIQKHPEHFKNKLIKKRALILEDMHQAQEKLEHIDYILHLSLSKSKGE